jgi:hypothetical protein
LRKFIDEGHILENHTSFKILKVGPKSFGYKLSTS